MNAIRVHQHGPPEVLRWEEVPDPPVRPGEVRIRVKACGVNHLDVLVRQGAFGAEVSLPRIPGADVSGVVDRVGASVTSVKPGDEVLVSPALSCGICEDCLSGKDLLCAEYSMLGYLVDGGYSTMVCVPAVNVLRKPEVMTHVQAATIPVAFGSAWHLLAGRAKVQPGEDVLVHSAGTGISIAAIQIAKLLGARVIATASSHTRLMALKHLGADEVIDHAATDFYGEVKRITQRKGVEVVVDQLGSGTFEKGLLCLAKDGRMVACGALVGSRASLDIRYLFTRHLTVMGSFGGTKADLGTVLSFFREGKLKPVVDRVYPLREASRAHVRVGERSRFGKIVLEV